VPRRTIPDPFAAKVGARVRELRTELGLSLSEVADAGLLSKGHLSSVEHGLAAINIETLQKIARALGVLPMDLLTFPGDDLRTDVGDLVRGLPEVELRKLRSDLQIRSALRKVR
jgi:transcriptional regulator with XRE-family HTH domain